MDEVVKRKRYVLTVQNYIANYYRILFLCLKKSTLIMIPNDTDKWK